MQSRCPPFLSEDELTILRPGFILTLGNSADAAMPRHPGYKPLRNAGSASLWRSRLAAKWGAVDVFGIYHPAYGGWHQSHKSLLRSLRAIGGRPLERRSGALVDDVVRGLPLVDDVVRDCLSLRALLCRHRVLGNPVGAC